MTVPRPLPATIDELTLDWLDAALAQSPVWDRGTVISIDVEPIGGNDALASAVFLAHAGVEARNGESDSVRLLLKMHARDPGTRDDASYAAEVYFYRVLAQRVETLVPKTYLADFDAGNQRLLIVQEFLSNGRVGSSERPLSIADLERVLSSLATLHACWWNAPEFTQPSRVATFDAAIQRAVVRLRSGELDVFRFLGRFGDLVSPDIVGYYESMPRWMEQVAGGFSKQVSLIHLDCSAKNVFIPRDPHANPILFDWALFRSGNVALDVATLLVYSLDPAEHHRLPELVRTYHDLLRAKGIRDLRYDELWHDVRLACLWRLAAPVANASHGTAARDRHVRTILPLVEAAARSCRAFELIAGPRSVHY